MKTLNALVMLVVSMVSLIADAIIVNSSTVRWPIGKHAFIQISVNGIESDQNGNILHRAIRNVGNKDFEIITQVSKKPGAVIEEIREEIKKQSPYNKLPNQVAVELYWQDMLVDITEEFLNEEITDLKALLSEKDNDGKTPVDLLKEQHPFFDDLSKEFSSKDFSINCSDQFLKALEELSQEGSEFQATKEERLSQNQVEKLLRNALLVKTYASGN
jgi:hypothetical protein